MKLFTAAILLIGAILPVHSAEPMLPAGVKDGYVLQWADEFDGNQLNTAEWKHRTDVRFASRNVAKNVSVQDGILKIAVKKEPTEGAEYTSGGVISKREFRHGYYEARMKVPAGAGWHTSFWMLKTTPGQEGNRQEIDVVEQDSKELTSYGSNLHTHYPKRVGLAGRRVKIPDLSKDFHVWGCEFSAHEIRYYFDGKLTGVMHANSFKHDDMSIWLTTVGWAKLPWAPQLKIDDAALPAFAEFDYVRFYSKPALANEVPPKPRTVVAFGDSLTEGGALPKDQRNKAWISVVEQESAGAIKMINAGKGGRPTAAKSEFDAMISSQPRADLLVIALGTNDSRDITPECVPKAVANVRYMIDRARNTYGPGLPILLLGPPNINKSALGPSKPVANEREQKLRELGDGFAQLAKEKECEYLSLFGMIPNESLLKDGVHPDAAGNASMAKVILPALLPKK